MKKAYENAVDNKSRAYIHFLFAKNYLIFDDGNSKENDFIKAKENYIKSLLFATKEQEKDFKRELETFFLESDIKEDISN
jgi:hypothetical protein